MSTVSTHTAEHTDLDRPPVGAVEFKKLLKKYAQSLRDEARLVARLNGMLRVSSVTDAATAAQEKGEIDRVKRAVYKHVLKRADLHAQWCLMLLKGSSSP